MLCVGCETSPTASSDLAMVHADHVFYGMCHTPVYLPVREDTTVVDKRHRHVSRLPVYWILLDCPNKVLLDCPNKVLLDCPKKVLLDCPNKVLLNCPKKVLLDCPNKVLLDCPKKVLLDCPNKVLLDCPN